MKPEITDVQRTLEYGHSHDLARQALPITLVGIALGLFVMTPLDGAAAERKIVLLGALVVAISLAFLAIVIYRRTQPSVPSIVLSPRGILFRDLSEQVIAWDEVREVGIAHVSATRDLFSTRVTKLVVSQRCYAALSGGRWLNSVIARDGEPSEIYLSYYYALPFEEFQEAVRRRWRAFSRHAAQTSPAETFAEGTPAARDRQPVAASHAPTRWRGGVKQRAASFAGLRALASLVGGSSPGQLLVIAAALAGIMALLTNQIGLWSTPAQERGRARAAEWRAWQERYEASRKATDEQQRQLRERLDRAFKCMEEYWALHDRGAYKQDPACMREGK